MTLQAVEQARAAYRERHISQHYSGPLHLRHHDRRLMTRYNFNITYPICHYIFASVYKDGD